MHSWGCKTACACIRNCQCKNAGLKWINMCSGCGGRTCNNSDLNDNAVWAQPFPVLHAQNVSSLLDFNSFLEPHIHIQSFTPLPWGGVHHHSPQTLLCFYVKLLWSWQSSHGRGLKRWIRVWDSEQLMWSIETRTFHLNAPYYHLIDEVTLNDTRHGHRVFLKN